jgi:hypothetical protein
MALAAFGEKDLVDITIAVSFRNARRLIPRDRMQASLGFRRPRSDEAPVLQVEGCRRSGADSHLLAVW